MYKLTHAQILIQKHKTAVYTLVNGGIQGLIHQKLQKIIKGDVARITLTVCQCAAE